MLAKNAGHKAYYSKVNTNPHPVGTVNHTYWRKAWLAAQADFNKRLARKGTPARCKRVIVNTESNGFLSPTLRTTQSQPEVQSVSKPHNAGNPGKKLLASTSGLISALKTFRETDKSYYVTYYGEGDKEIRISKDDPRRRIFDTMEAAEAWAMGEPK